MDSAASLEDSVRRCLRSLDGAESGIVIAVSGGTDSVALLRLALAVRAADTPLIVAHLNHRLRGAESDDDEEFVIGLHARLAHVAPNLFLRTERLDVAALARAERGNLEATARSARYRWLAEVARETATSWVLTGHTANDQAETVLHHLLRGAGLQGLRGIAERRPLDENTSLVRPLLGALHDDLLAYLHHLGQDAREDSSNRDLQFTRNRIRHELLPHLAERYNPAIVSVLVRVAGQADEAHRFETAEALALLKEAELPRAGSVLVFDAERLALAPRLLVRVLFRLVWVRENWPTGRMDFASWERLAGLVFDGEGSSDFAGGVHARRVGRAVQMERKRFT